MNRLKFLSLDSGSWETDLNEITEKIPEVNRVGSPNQYHYDLQSNNLLISFQLHLANIVNDTLERLESAHGIYLKNIRRKTVEKSEAICGPLETGENCFTSPSSPTYMSESCSVDATKLKEVNLNELKTNDASEKTKCAMLVQKMGHRRFVFKDETCFIELGLPNTPLNEMYRYTKLCENNDNRVYVLSDLEIHSQCPFEFPYATSAFVCCRFSMIKCRPEHTYYCPLSPCSNHILGISDTAYASKKTSLALSIRYIRVAATSQEVQWSTASVNVVPPNSDTAMFFQYRNPQESEIDSLIVRADSVLLDGVEPDIRYDVCAVPVLFGDKAPLTTSFCDRLPILPSKPNITKCAQVCDEDDNAIICNVTHVSGINTERSWHYDVIWGKQRNIVNCEKGLTCDPNTWNRKNFNRKRIKFVMAEEEFAGSFDTGALDTEGSYEEYVVAVRAKGINIGYWTSVEVRSCPGGMC